MSEAARALDEVIRQFGRHVLARPDRLRAALADILLTDDEGPGVDALVAVSSTGVASGLEASEGPVTQEQVAEWFDRLAAVGLSRSDAASATAVWAQVLGPVERAREVSEISRTLSIPSIDSAGTADATVMGQPDGDVTVVGEGEGEPLPAPDVVRPRPRFPWLWLAAGVLVILAMIAGVTATVLSAREPEAVPSRTPSTLSPRAAAMPIVVFSEDAVPEIRIPPSDPPDRARSIVVEPGFGDPVLNSVTMRYHSITWGGVTVDSNWMAGEPTEFALGDLLPALREALENAQGETRLLVVLPPAAAYGAMPGHPYEEDTIVFAIEITNEQ